MKMQNRQSLEWQDNKIKHIKKKWKIFVIFLYINRYMHFLMKKSWIKPGLRSSLTSDFYGIHIYFYYIENNVLIV